MMKEDPGTSVLSDEIKEGCLARGQRLAYAEMLWQKQGAVPPDVETLQDVLSGKDAEIEKEVEVTVLSYEAQAQAIEERIRSSTVMFRELEVALEKANTFLAEQVMSIPGKREALLQLIEELYALAKELGVEKSAVVTKKIAAFRQHVSDALDGYKATEESVNTRLADEHGKRKQEFESRLKELAEDIKEMTEKQTKLSALSKALVHLRLNGFLSYLFITIAAIAVLMSGNLLAVYFTTNERAVETLANDNILSQVIKGITGLTFQYSAWVIVVGFVVFVLLNYLVGLICEHLLLRHLSPGKKGKITINRRKSSDGSEEYIIEDNTRLEQERDRIKYRRWTTTILRYTPISFFIVLGIVMISQGNRRDNAALTEAVRTTAENAAPASPAAIPVIRAGDETVALNRDGQLAKQALGSVMTILLAGVLVMYIKLHRVPRFLRALKDGPGPGNFPGRFFMHYEVVIIASLFLLFFVAVVGCLTRLPVSEKLIMLAGYIGSSFTGAFLLAWVYYSHSLAVEESNNEAMLADYRRLQKRLTYPDRMSLIPSAHFNEILREGMDKLEDLLVHDIGTVAGMWKRQGAKGYVDWNAFAAGINAQSVRDGSYAINNIISKEELACFPEFEKRFLVLRDRIDTLRSEINYLENVRETMNVHEDAEKSQIGIYSDGIKGKAEKQLDALEETLEHLRRQQRDLQAEMRQSVLDIRLRGENIRHWILKGYHSIQRPGASTQHANTRV